MCFEECIEITEQDKQAGFMAIEVEVEKAEVAQICPVKRVGDSYRIVKCAIEGQPRYKVQYYGIAGPREQSEVITGTPPQKLRWQDSPEGLFDSADGAERHIASDPDRRNTFQAGNAVNE